MSEDSPMPSLIDSRQLPKNATALRALLLTRQRFGSSPEKLRSSIDRLQLILGDLEEDEAEAAPEVVPENRTGS